MAFYTAVFGYCDRCQKCAGLVGIMQFPDGSSSLKKDTIPKGWNLILRDDEKNPALFFCPECEIVVQQAEKKEVAPVVEEPMLG
jgi:hypothetical protein